MKPDRAGNDQKNKESPETGVELNRKSMNVESLIHMFDSDVWAGTSRGHFYYDDDLKFPDSNKTVIPPQRKEDSSSDEEDDIFEQDPGSFDHIIDIKDAPIIPEQPELIQKLPARNSSYEYEDRRYTAHHIVRFETDYIPKRSIPDSRFHTVQLSPEMRRMIEMNVPQSVGYHRPHSPKRGRLSRKTFRPSSSVSPSVQRFDSSSMKSPLREQKSKDRLQRQSSRSSSHSQQRIDLSHSPVRRSSSSRSRTADTKIPIDRTISSRRQVKRTISPLAMQSQSSDQGPSDETANMISGAAISSSTTTTRPGIQIRKIQPAPWELNETTTTTTESDTDRSISTRRLSDDDRPPYLSSYDRPPVGIMSDSHVLVESPSANSTFDQSTTRTKLPSSVNAAAAASTAAPFYTTAALARMAKEQKKLVELDPDILRTSRYSLHNVEYYGDTVKKSKAALNYKRNPFHDSHGKSVDFISKEEQRERNARGKARRVFCISAFIFLAVIMVGTGILVALWRTGVFDSLAVVINGGSNDPTQQLIISSLTPPGPFGCSNVPRRAAKRSNQLSGPKASSSLGNACPAGSFRYTLTECDVQSLMYPTTNATLSQQNYQDNYVKLYVGHLNDALEYYDLNCAKPRLIAFLAQLKHETLGLTTMRQPLDGGAGSIHLLPAHFSNAISAIPQAKTIYEQSERSRFAEKYSLAELKRIGNNYATYAPGSPERTFMEDVANSLIARPEITFLTGGWWFKEGAAGALPSCGDLRIVGDGGLGGSPATNSTMAGPTGYYQISQCIFGTATDPGIQQRVGFYKEVAAKNNFKCQTKSCPSES